MNGSRGWGALLCLDFARDPGPSRQTQDPAHVEGLVE